MAINTTTDSRPDRPRSIVHLPSHRSEFFSSRQSPLLPPPTRKNDLPYSSQSGPSERHSSPVKDPVQSESEVNKPVAGPSKSRSRSPVPISEPVAMQSSTGWSDDEDDFDGIEDAVATQSIPVMKAERGLGKGRGAVTLDDLFDDETEEDMYKDQAATSSRSGIRSSAETRTRVEDLVDLSQSPSPGSMSRSLGRGSSPGLSGQGNHFHSDTPPSPLPKTPQTDDTLIPWSPSPVTQRTKRRTIDDHKSPFTSTGVTTIKAESTKKGKEKHVPPVQDEEEEEYEYENVDFPFPDDLDFEMMDAHPTTNTSTSSRPGSSTSYPAAADPGRSFRPSSITHTTFTLNHNTYPAVKPAVTGGHSSPPRHIPSDQSHIASMLDEMDDPNRLLLITDLTRAEQDFYRNHWRRGADKGSKKKTKKGDDGDEEDYEDGGFTGPQPTEKKKTFKRGGGFKRGGFRGRGRGKARGRSRK